MMGSRRQMLCKQQVDVKYGAQLQQLQSSLQEAAAAADA
jgi:hypothetical protein